MAIFVTGATGYIGGAVAAQLVADGREVRGLVRTEEKAKQLVALGIIPVLGSLDDADILTREARASEGVINAADSDHRGAVEALIEGLAGSGKPLLQTSGSGFLAKDTGGDIATEQIFDDSGSFIPEPDENGDDRAAIDQLVRDAAHRGVRSAVLCNTCIYGLGKGLHPESIMMPWLIKQARKEGIVRYIGKGESIWSNVHIDDVVDLYIAALAGAFAGSFYFVENGEASFAQVAKALARRLNLGEAKSWSVEEATAECGHIYAYIFGSNSRVRATRARAELNWRPKYESLLEWIGREA